MAEDAQSLKEFYSSVDRATGFIREEAGKGGPITLISHIDADGLTAASIMSKTLTRLEVPFRLRVWKQMDNTLVEELSSEEPSLLVFTDLGSGSLGLLKSKLANWDIVVLDHHEIVDEPSSKIIHVNPHVHGIDGSRDVSGSGVAYLTAKSVDGGNIDLAPLAVVGALGDLQDKNPKRELGGLNGNIVKDAIDSGCMQAETDLILYGRETRPIHKALSYTTSPYLPGLSGEEDKCLGFLVNLGIELKAKDRWRTISDLSVEEKQKIFSEIAKLLSSKNLSSSVALSLIGTVYTLVREDRWTSLRDAREFSSLLNACGRMSKSGLGVSIGMGSRGKVLDEAQELLTNYRRTLSEYMNWLTTTPRATEELKNIYVIRGTGVIDDLMISTMASILTSSGFFSENKPIIALTSAENGMIKVSGRIPAQIADRGINMGTILHDASVQFKGIGGGHDVAAGAQLPQEFEKDFVKTVDQLVGSSAK